jgi:hypothetical protein
LRDRRVDAVKHDVGAGVPIHSEPQPGNKRRPAAANCMQPLPARSARRESARSVSIMAILRGNRHIGRMPLGTRDGLMGT